MIFTLLVLGASSRSGAAVATMCGLGIAGFYFYQIIDSVRSARACNWGKRLPTRLDWEQLSAPASVWTLAKSRWARWCSSD